MTTFESRAVQAYLIALCLVVPAQATRGASILDTQHNLSISGPGPIKSITEEQVCIFCHTPHKARRDVPYLWNRTDSAASYITYESSTLYASVGQPSGASKLCLSCHDGTIALGSVLSRPAEIPFAGGVRFLPEGTTRLGTDISDDHPISFSYDEALAATNGELVSPSTLTSAVRLDRSGLLQCTACHDPHDDRNGKFLVLPNDGSALCTTCHERTAWDASSHATSLATWNGAGSDPWPHTPFNSVAENACASCHRPHMAGSRQRLLNFAIEEDNCLVCHSGHVAAGDIEAELTKQFRHPVQDFAGIHDPAEDFTGVVAAHVECADCHNPHRARSAGASAPLVPGALRGVKGINSSGAQVAESAYSYEICFKCHADNNVLSFSEITRQIPQVNTRLELDTTNPSYHPVAGVGQNPDVPSLLSPYTVSSVIYCTDCHDSDGNPDAGGTGVKGPHGSIHKFLLERNYTTLDNTRESAYEYALCYKCHSRTSILDNESFSKHKKHIRDERVPCAVCHDPHGISSTQGNAINNAHLINFDLNVVSPTPSGRLEFEDLGVFAGRCFLVCHGEKHDPEE